MISVLESECLGVHKLDSVAIQFDICCFGEGAWTE